MDVEVDLLRDHQAAERLVQLASLQNRLARIGVDRGAFVGLDRGRTWQDRIAHQRPALPPEQALDEALDAFGRAQREQDQDRREDQPPVFRDGRKPVLQQDERDRAPQRPKEVVNAAEHRHQQ